MPPERFSQACGHAMDPARGSANVEDLPGPTKIDRDRNQLGAASQIDALPGRGNEEVKDHILLRGVDDHETARAQPG